MSLSNGLQYVLLPALASGPNKCLPIRFVRVYIIRGKIVMSNENYGHDKNSHDRTESVIRRLIC